MSKRIGFGLIVAVVVATSRNAAKDAAELIEIDWEPLPAVARGPADPDARAP